MTMSEYSAMSQEQLLLTVQERDQRIAELEAVEQQLHIENETFGREYERLRAVYEAAVELKIDLLLRADIGTYDGDHSVQASQGIWFSFCKAIEAAQENDDGR
jgi:hypothetical protein